MELVERSSHLAFGLHSGRGASFKCTGLGMDCGLPEFPILVSSDSSVSNVEGNIVSYSLCTTTNVLCEPVNFAHEVESLAPSQALSKHSG